MNITEEKSLIYLDKVCRLCLSRKRAMLSIFDEDGMSPSLASNILSYIGIEVTISDGLPTLICNNCLTHIEAWHTFREKCRHCDEVLRQCIKRNSGLKVKQKSNIIVGNSVSSQVVMKILASNETDLIIENDCLCSGTENISLPHTKQEDTEAWKGINDDNSSLRNNDTPNNSETNVQVSESDDDIGKSKIDIDDNPTIRELNKEDAFLRYENSNTDCVRHEAPEQMTYGCSKCGNTFSYTSSFTFHICNLSPEKRYVCNLCGKDYSTAGAVKTHLHIHKGKHKCPTCGKSFPSKFQVEVHMRIHTGEKPFVCEFCGKRFAYDKGLTLHMSVHTGIKPYKCDECSYSTTSRSYIKNHKSVHRTEKPFVCEICGQGYTLLPSLMNHQLNHNDQKTFTCDVCNKAFNTSRKLASHKIMHSGVRPYHCEDCGKRFARKEGLKEHKVIHTGEKKFVCLVCKKHFAWRKILRTHKCVGVSQ
ncbi:putative zinc finger protein 66 [Periplaneta americana]|uniref:putative zinc finger protein 66 n=1 Tax=Periplaneta americana TaxID=6978 RepID=UPI0037E78335